MTDHHSISRRRTLQKLAGGGVIALMGGTPLVGCSGVAASQPDEDDDALLARLAAQPATRIMRRDKPYRMTRPLRLPTGRTLTIAGGTRFTWAGPTQSADGRLIAVIEAIGDDVAIVVEGGRQATIESVRPSAVVYAVGMRGRRGLTVSGINALDCQHVFVESTAGQYESVRMDGNSPTSARNIRIQGGGARFRARAPESHGACYLAYADDCRVEGAHYENVSHGVQWWGGDSNFSRNGELANERKCRSIVVRHVTVRAAIGGIWGSMGRNVVVQDCSVSDCDDVCFDAEGCIATLFERCVARNGRNGCFATFFYNDGVRFLNCTGSVDKKEFPLFRVYNSSQNSLYNKGLEIIGGSYSCLDPSGPSTIDTASGPVQQFTITGAKLSNVRIDTAFFNMHRTTIRDNILVFPYAFAGFPAIRTGASKLLQEKKAIAGATTVENNRIEYRASAPTQAAAIQVREDDFNSAASGRIVGNTISGPFLVGVSLVNASKNAGIAPSFVVQRNRFNGLPGRSRMLDVNRESGTARKPTVNWDNSQTRDGRATSLADAIGP